MIRGLENSNSGTQRTRRNVVRDRLEERGGIVSLSAIGRSAAE
jgi:hypothetical protein